MDNKKIELFRNVIESSNYLVCITDRELKNENGYPLIQDSDWAYEIEQKYGASPEEIFNSSYYSNRKEQFFNFYRDEILSRENKPNETYRALAKLQERGILKAVVTKSLYSLAKRAGCHNVIEMHGSIYTNYCSHCRKPYSIDYVRNSKKVPLCEKCKSVIRPGVFLYGEMMDNQIMTKAMEEVLKADVLMVLGGNLKSPTAGNCLRYFYGNKLLVIHKEPHFTDEKADLVINDEVRNVLPKIVGL